MKWEDSWEATIDENIKKSEIIKNLSVAYNS